MTDALGNPVNLWDVVVTDDGFGNAQLNFPNGESVVLQGITPAQMSTSQQLLSAGIPCFTEGTMILTPSGERPIETLEPGDLVCTMDNGPQPVLWSGRSRIGAAQLRRFPKLKPIYIAKGAFGNHTPLLVSPQLGMLVHSESGDSALARAIHLSETTGAVRQATGKKSVTYLHLMFASHQIVFGNGAPSESFYPGPWGLGMLGPRELATILGLFPRLADTPARKAYGPPARDVLSKKDVLAMASACAA